MTLLQKQINEKKALLSTIQSVHSPAMTSFRQTQSFLSCFLLKLHGQGTATSENYCLPGRVLFWYYSAFSIYSPALDRQLSMIACRNGMANQGSVVTRGMLASLHKCWVNTCHLATTPVIHPRGVRHCKKVHRVHSQISAALGTLPLSQKGNFPPRDNLNLVHHTLFDLLDVLIPYFSLYILYSSVRNHYYRC